MMKKATKKKVHKSALLTRSREVSKRCTFIRNCDKNKFHVFNGIFVRRVKKESCECLFEASSDEDERTKAFFNERFEKLILWTEEDKLYSPTKIHISIKLTATRERETEKEKQWKVYQNNS